LTSFKLADDGGSEAFSEMAVAPVMAEMIVLDEEKERAQGRRLCRRWRPYRWALLLSLLMPGGNDLLGRH
jgi:hypothetical protein